MTNFHAIYRAELDDDGHTVGWATYSFPVSVYLGGATLEQARAEFREAAESTVEDFDQYDLVEHLELPLFHGAYVRRAIDRRTLDRDEAAAAMQRALTVEGQRTEFETKMPLAASGDAIVIACVADDTLAWVFEQIDSQDAVGVCLAAPEMVWWSFITAADPHVGPLTWRRLTALSDAGLSGESTVSEFLRSSGSPTRKLIAATA